jgi:hypothetical protein
MSTFITQSELELMYELCMRQELKIDKNTADIKFLYQGAYVILFMIAIIFANLTLIMYNFKN